MKLKLNQYLLFIIIFYLKTSYGQSFIDKANSFGINHTVNTTDNYGSGVNFFDFDNDGWDDLTLLRENDSILFYKNMGGTFVKLDSYIFNSGATKQVLWVDYDNDGYNDMIVTNLNGRLMLYHNDGTFNFTLSNLTAGIPFYTSPNRGVSFGDYNKDGLLDFYICRYSYTSDSLNTAELSRLYKNTGNGTFTDVTDIAGLNTGLEYAFQGVWLDYDNDTWPDLYVINDRSRNNFLFKNNQNGTFSDVSQFSQTQDTGFNASPMTNTVGDFDNDGDLDIYMTNIGGSNQARLLVNNGNGTFTDHAQALGVDLERWSWGATWIDVDNDGQQDLYVTTTEISSEIRSYLYMNTGANWFNDSPQLFSGNHIASSFAVAKGDYNHDGFADLIVQNGLGYNSFFWANTGGANHFVNTTVHGTLSNKMAIGTWIKVYIGNKLYTHYTFCGENYMSQNSQHHLFGLEQETKIDSIIVIYNSGITDRYYDLNVDSWYDFYEGETYHNYISASGTINFCAGDSVQLDAGNYSSYLWSNGSHNRYITVYSSGNYWVDVTDSMGFMIPSDTLPIQAVNPPQISIYGNDLSCFNANDGEIMLDVQSFANTYGIIWDNGLMGDTILNLTPGNYTYSYIDDFGCMTTDSMRIYSPYAINLQTLVTPYSNLNFGSIQSIVNGGTPPYTIYFDSLISGNLIDSLMPGSYLYEVYDANNCYYNTTITIIDLTVSGFEKNQIDVQLYPNPMEGNSLTIKSNKTMTALQIFDFLGQEIPYSLNNGIVTITEAYKGILYLKIRIENKEINYKILKL